MRILYIDNYDSFANTIAACFEDAGADVRVYKSDTSMETIAAQPKDMILLGPGPSGPKEAGDYLDVIDRYHKKTPLFGICLGHQALMEYFGEQVLPLEEVIHGASSPVEHDGRTIFKGIPDPAHFGRYHSLGVRKVPECFEVSAHCGDVVMAARHKELPIESVQFHPESVLSMEDDVGRRVIGNVAKIYGRLRMDGGFHLRDAWISDLD